MTAFITITNAGTDTGPFNLYSDVDGFVAPFDVDVSKTDLEAGYAASGVPDNTNIIRVKSNNDDCGNFVDSSNLTGQQI